MAQGSKNTFANKQERIIAALDVGTTKICCFIAKIGADNSINILGTGYRISEGVKGGSVVDMEATEASIRAAVDQAERIANKTVDEVIVSLTGGKPLSHIVDMEIEIKGHEVNQSDIDRVLKQASAQIDPGERQIIHAFPACFSIDGSPPVRDPISMFGERLAVAMHVIDAFPGPMRNLEACVQRAHLHAARMVLSPYASGLATLVDDEKMLGAACVDIGGGATSISVFAKNAMVHAEVIQTGGDTITEAIARELLTPLHEAERLKIFYGSAVATQTDGQETIDVPQLGEAEKTFDEENRVPKSYLTGLIQPRIEKILLSVRSRLQEIGFDSESGRQVVLTGGVSLLPGIQDLAQRVLGKKVRIGKPRGINGLADAMSGPAFSACAGLLVYASRAPRELGEHRLIKTIENNDKSLAGSISNWLKGNF
ncbi:MAG: cell division protein FtsA [Sphingomonadales bacterium]